MIEYFTSGAVNREVLLWAVATRTQLDRWEALVARHKKSRAGGVFAKYEHWQMQYERYFCLAAVKSLLDAIELLIPALEIDAVVRNELKEARDLTQHWRENMPIFNTRPRTRTPPRRSGRAFADRNPELGPYGFWSWSSQRGAMITPNVSAPTVHKLLDQVESRILAADPRLEEFVPPRIMSPWVDDPFTNGFWPR